VFAPSQFGTQLGKHYAKAGQNLGVMRKNIEEQQLLASVVATANARTAEATSQLAKLLTSVRAARVYGRQNSTDV
jgi:hypothetical protein